MLVLILQLQQLANCYKSESTIEVSEIESTLILHLESNKEPSCENISSGVLIWIQFDDPALDQQTTLIEYGYGTTSEIRFPVDDILPYFLIQTSLFTIQTYNQIYQQNLQQVVITKNDKEKIFTNFTVSYDEAVFEGWMNFPETFTEFNVLDAFLVICNYEECFRVEFDGTSTVDLAGKLLTINFPNTELAVVLYTTGITNITISCDYGQTAYQNAVEITYSLSYKDQPSPGAISRIQLYQASFYFECKQSKYVTEQLAIYPKIVFDLRINGGVCNFQFTLDNESLFENQEIKGRIRMMMDARTFEGQDIIEGRLPYSECMEYTKESGKNSITRFHFFDEDDVARNIVVLSSDKFGQSCYSNPQISLEDTKILITSNSTCDVKNYTNADLKLCVFPTQKDYFLNEDIIVSTIKINLSSVINSVIYDKEQKVIKQVQSAYAYIIKLTNEDGGFIDSFEPSFQTSSMAQAISYNAIVLGGSASVCVILGGAQIFSSKSKKVKKQKMSNFLSEEI